MGTPLPPKEDLNPSPADLVYRAPLTVPGDFVQDPPQTSVDEHLRQLCERVSDLRPVPASAHDQIKTNFPNSLDEAKFVFVRKEFKKSPLQDPYS